jgi:hypothetical protein
MADKVSVELTEKLLIEQASQWLSRMIPTFVNALNARADAADPLSCIYEGKLAGKLPVRVHVEAEPRNPSADIAEAGRLFLAKLRGTTGLVSEKTGYATYWHLVYRAGDHLKCESSGSANGWSFRIFFETAAISESGLELTPAAV